MTPGINLLPPRHVERLAERRQAAVTAAALVLLLGLLVLAATSQGRELRDAEKTRDVERTRIAELQARREKLASFRPLAAGIVGRERLLAAAMRTQVSWSTMLTSLSQSFPAGASLTSLTADLKVPAFGAVPAADAATQSVIGSTALSGYSIEEFTPGVQQTLRLLDTVTGLAEPRMQAGSAREIGERPVTGFDGTTFIDGAALTRRYADGLPPEYDVDVPNVGGSGAGSAARANGTSGAPG